MVYNNIRKGTFLSRPNRFIAHVIIDGKTETAHVKNTGRCRELLYRGVTVYLQHHENENRKTKWSLIGVEKGNQLVNIDSQAPNKVIFEWLLEGKLINGIQRIKPEYVYGDSRVDFFVETESEKILIEVKGVTLEENGVAMFPDAPTERGIKHMLELCKSIEAGYRAYVIFVIQMAGVRCFTPNTRTHQAFADALLYAAGKGVHVMALDCDVRQDGMIIRGEVPCRLHAAECC